MHAVRIQIFRSVPSLFIQFESMRVHDLATRGIHRPRLDHHVIIVVLVFLQTAQPHGRGGHAAFFIIGIFVVPVYTAVRIGLLIQQVSVIIIGIFFGPDALGIVADLMRQDACFIKALFAAHDIVAVGTDLPAFTVRPYTCPQA